MGSGTKILDMDKPPPYEAHQGSNNPAYSYPVQDAKWQDGYSNPGYAYDTSYTPTKNVEHSQAYNPPIVSNIDYSSEVNPNFYSTQSAKSSSKKTAVGDGAQCDMTSFGEQAIRRGFIRKVYSILCCQLVITGGVIALCLFVEPVKEYVQQNDWVLFACIGVTMFCILTMACFKDVRRTSPGNFICLGIFTICESCMLGTVSTYYDVDAVILAVGITVAVTFGLTIFSFQTKYDFTSFGGVLFALLLVLVIAGFCIPFSGLRTVRIVYGAAGALLFSFYIIYDTQIMMGGKHKYAISPEEYIFAALNLYLDVINLFLHILMIFGGSGKK